MTDYDDVNPLVIVGLEGLWGTIMMGALLVVFQFVPCSNADLCNGGVIENSYNAFQSMQNTPMQWVFTLAILPLACLSNTSGTSVTAYGSAAARCTLEQVRNLFVWIYFMFIPVGGILLEEFNILQLFGFIILLAGIFIFNEIITMSMCYSKEQKSLRDGANVQISVDHLSQILDTDGDQQEDSYLKPNIKKKGKSFAI